MPWRNEGKATIGVRCGVSLEFIFVDDNSSDDSVAVARRAVLSITGNRRDTQTRKNFPSPGSCNGEGVVLSTSAFAWRGSNSSSFS